MKNNEKHFSYIQKFEFVFKKSLHPAYKILKPFGGRYG